MCARVQLYVRSELIFEFFRTHVRNQIHALNAVSSCSLETQFFSIPKEYRTLSTTLLLPLAAMATLAAVLELSRVIYQCWQPAPAPTEAVVPGSAVKAATAPSREGSMDITGQAGLDDGAAAALAYIVAQAGIFFALAALVMRLKLFAVPMLIILAAQWAGKLGENALARMKLPRATLFAIVIPLLLAGSAVQGVQNVRRSLQRVGEFNQPRLIELINHVRRLERPGQVYAGRWYAKVRIRPVLVAHPCNVNPRRCHAQHGFHALSDQRQNCKPSTLRGVYSGGSHAPRSALKCPASLCTAFRMPAFESARTTFTMRLA